MLAGRGAGSNPPNRFDPLHVERDPDAPEGDHTVYYRDSSRSILVENDSPDVGCRWGINPYRGCEHGCVYCFARPTHQYLGFSAGIDFERRIMVKNDAPTLLRAALHHPRWQPAPVMFSGNTDCYQPVERSLGITRRCLQVFAEFRNPVSMITKSALVARDVDVLSELARHQAVHVMCSVTTLDADLARRLEPRASAPAKRLEAIAALAAADIPVAVMIGPVLPGLNDAEIPRILEAAAARGARGAAWVLLRLPAPVDALFVSWLETHFPDRKERVLGRIRECRGGDLTESRFGIRQRGAGPYAQQIGQLFEVMARRHGLSASLPSLNTAAFRRPPRAGDQLALL